MTSTNETLDMAKNSLRKRFNSNSLQQLLIFATWIVLLIGFSIADPHFMRMGNIVALLLASAVTGIQALGVTFTIATGGIDITPGLGMDMTGVITAMCMTAFHLPIWLAVLAGILPVRCLVGSTVCSLRVLAFSP
mgnify:CR=1 FL=1